MSFKVKISGTELMAHLEARRDYWNSQAANMRALLDRVKNAGEVQVLVDIQMDAAARGDMFSFLIAHLDQTQVDYSLDIDELQRLEFIP